MDFCYACVAYNIWAAFASIDQLRRERLSYGVKPWRQFRRPFWWAKCAGEYGQNGMVTSCVQRQYSILSLVQSAEQIGSKRIVTGKHSNFLPKLTFSNRFVQPIVPEIIYYTISDCTQLVTIPFWPMLTCTFCPPKWPPKLTPTTNTFVVIMAL